MNRLPVPARATLPGLGVLVVGLSLPYWLIQDQYMLVIAITVVIWSIAAQGWNVIGGYGGLLSFGHSVFFGIGAYTTAILQTRWGVSPWIGMIIGAVLAAVVGAVLTFPALRLRGVYFTLATFVLALLLTDLAVIAIPVTGGDLGITLPFIADDPAMLQFGSRLTLYFVVVVFLTFATLIVGIVAYSKLGLFLRASRDDPDAARASGVDVTRVRLVGLMISAAITSVAGSLMLAYLNSVTPSTGFAVSVAFIIAMGALVGGRGTIFGPIIGTAILIPAQQVVASIFSEGPTGMSGIVYAVIVIGVILLDSRGIMHLLTRLGRTVGRIRPPGSRRFTRRCGGSAPMSLLTVSHVTVAFGGVLAVNEVSLTVEKGEILGLVGPNGAGKSTLFGAIAGAVPMRSGEIALDGARLPRRAPSRIAKMGVARTFQKVRLFSSLTVEENVLVAARAHLGRRDAKAAVEEALNTARYAGDPGAIVTAIPLADRKRVEIARALVSRPRLLLLDEMMNGLTGEETEALIESIKQLPERGITVMLVEHVLHVVRSLCSRLVVLHHGQLIADGDPGTVLARPDVVEAWMGSAPREAE